MDGNLCTREKHALLKIDKACINAHVDDTSNLILQLLIYHIYVRNRDKVAFHDFKLLLPFYYPKYTAVKLFSHTQCCICFFYVTITTIKTLV